MATSLFLAPSDPHLEAVYVWLEHNNKSQVQLWGHENQRRAALLAYSDEPGDTFGWSNWASKAEDPSNVLALFDQLELVAEDDQAVVLNATFLGVFSPVAKTTFG